MTEVAGLLILVWLLGRERATVAPVSASPLSSGGVRVTHLDQFAASFTEQCVHVAQVLRRRKVINLVDHDIELLHDVLQPLGCGQSGRPQSEGRSLRPISGTLAFLAMCGSSRASAFHGSMVSLPRESLTSLPYNQCGEKHDEAQRCRGLLSKRWGCVAMYSLMTRRSRRPSLPRSRLGRFPASCHLGKIDAPTRRTRPCRPRER